MCTFFVGIFLDPWYYLQLEDHQRFRAKEHLKQLHLRALRLQEMKYLNKEETSDEPNLPLAIVLNEEDDDIEELLKSREQHDERSTSNATANEALQLITLMFDN